MANSEFVSRITSLVIVLICQFHIVRSTDLDILYSFKLQLQDLNSFLSSWNLSNPCSSWAGVTCLKDNSTVTDLSISNMNLSGTLPSPLGELRHLQGLDLSHNNFRGKINLLSNIPKLKFLKLDNNSFTGAIPSGITKLTRLSLLSLVSNNFSGEIPSGISNLRHLEDVYLSRNNFTGNVPDFGNCTKLKNLALSYNKLQGEIPPSLGTLPQLTNLWMNDNELSGAIPQELGQHSNLTILYMSSNKFTGSIPLKLCRNGALERVYLHNNRLEGGIPRELLGCPRLERLLLHDNFLNGSVPKGVQNLNLNFLDLSNNLLQGYIPIELANWVNLTSLLLSNNKLSGQVPTGFAFLQQLNVSHNRLTGGLPSSMKGTKVFTLDISYNLLEGVLPQDIQRFAQLRKLYLQGNRFFGKIPGSLENLGNLEELDLSNNSFTGLIPDELGSLQSLRKLDLHSNQLSGEIPSHFGDLSKLEYLDLSNNTLQGRIPMHLDNLLSLSYVNLSFNHDLVGPLPSTWNKFNSSSFLGINNSSSEHHRGLSKTHKALILSASGFILLVVSVLLTMRCKRQQDDTFYRFSDKKFTLGRILRATNGLSREFVIGEGGYGTVYKVCMENGPVLAVKKLKIVNEETLQSLTRECETAGRVRHRNVLKIRGMYKHNESVLLVSDFMPNGSLAGLLHESHDKKVSWEERREIAIGVAYGLKYLHHDCVPKIIHRDIKSNNVLLDEDMVPKIADFGLAKLVEKHAETKSMSYIAGSYGYIAPEYAYTLKVNEKSDVYSFGVVLLELLLRKSPLDALFSCSEDGDNMPMWIKDQLSRPGASIERVLDQEIWQEAEQKQEIESFVKVALLCTNSNPSGRPSMDEVVEMLRRSIHTS